jgi:hypothetical protein
MSTRDAWNIGDLYLPLAQIEARIEQVALQLQRLADSHEKMVELIYESDRKAGEALRELPEDDFA